MSRSSPTTTRAVNEKRRPPLTTLATRLISTTRSWRSRPPALTVLSMVWIGMTDSERLEGQAALPSGLGQRLDAAVVLVAAAVEHGALDARGLGTLGQRLADLRGLVGLGDAAELGPLGGRERTAVEVVDE